MKPKISVVLVSHQKPAFVKQAIASVQAQTFEDWEMVIVDSGKLFDASFFNHLPDDERWWFIRSRWEQGAATRNQHSFVVNNILDALSGDLILLLCDDDWFYPWAFQTFWDFHERTKADAMYASIHLGRADAAGNTEFIGERIADVPRGRHCGGPALDCQVDYLQFCFSQAALKAYAKVWPGPVLSERLEDKGHADGIFMERMGEILTVHRVGYFVGMNRRTPASVNCGS